MQYDELYTALQERVKLYREARAQTVDIDLEIMKALSVGASPARVSIDTHCDISTVYRSIARVKKFLQNEPRNDAGVLNRSFVVSNAVTCGCWTHRSSLGMNLYFLLITFHQMGYNSVVCSEVKRYLPGLRNKKQRGTVLAELNALFVQTEEEESKKIKIFKFVEYRNHAYHFELTEDAYPYYYPLYQLLGRHPQLLNLCN